jgi:16S rRNA (guanine527-N7)-methyltransferase
MAAAEPGRVASRLLREGLSLLEVPGAERAAVLFERYISELEKWNPRFGLVKASGEELVVKHVLDSISAWRVVSALAAGGRLHSTAAPAAAPAPGGTVLDVGSGAGFPGIPLAAVLPSLSFTLLERSSRRAAFLGNCALLLGLANVRVLESDLSGVSRGGAPAFDVLTLRAFAPLGRFLDDLARAGLRWGAIVAYKGKASRVREELEEIGPARASGAQVLPVSVPFLDEERHLVVIRA